MAESFVEGLAEGVSSGLAANRAAKQQDFENQRQLGVDQRAATAQAAQLDTLQQQKIQAAIDATNAQREQLRGEAASDPGYAADPATRRSYKTRADQLNAHYTELLRHKGGADLTTFARDAAATQRQLASGQTTFSGLDPKAAADFVAYHINRPAKDILDTDQQKSPIGQALERFHEGMARISQDNGEELIGAASDLFGHELEGLVGQTAYDGISKVTKAEFAAPVPQPGDPGSVLLTARLTVQRPDGAVGTQVVPILDSHGTILAHPDESKDARGNVTPLSHFFDSVGTLETLYKAINSDPAARQKLQEAGAAGHDDVQAQRAFLLRSLGGDPNEYTPKRGDLVIDPTTGQPLFESQPGQKTTVLPIGLEVARTKGEFGETRGLRHDETLIEIQKLKNAASRARDSSGGGLSAGLYTPDALALNSAIIESGGKGFISARDRVGQALQANDLARRAAERGNTAEEEAQHVVAARQSQQALSELTKREAALNVNARNAENNLTTVERLSKRVDRTGSPIINKLTQAFSTEAVQDPDLRALKNAVTETAIEYSKVVTSATGAAAPTDSAQKLTQQLLSASDSADGFAKSIAAARELIKNRRDGFQAEKQELIGSLRPISKAGVQQRTPLSAPGASGLSTDAKPAAGDNTIDAAGLQKYASKHGITPEQARVVLTGRGLQVQ